MSVRLDVRLPVSPSAARAARHAVRELAGVLSAELLSELELVVSELVTNSVRHARLGPEGSIRLRVEADENRVAGEVMDSGHGFRPTARRNGREGHWGLLIVDRLARRWDVVEAAGTAVRFELTSADG